MTTLQADVLVIGGGATGAGVAWDCALRGYDTILVGDAHTTEDLTSFGAPSPDKVIAHTNMYWSWQAGVGREAGVVATSDVAFHADERQPSG